MNTNKYKFSINNKKLAIGAHWPLVHIGNSRGFTFIELLVVVTIIALISGVAVASYQTTNQRARDARRKSDLEQIRAALELCRSEAGLYPSSIASASPLECDDGNTYLNPVPSDPRDGQDGYVYTYERGYDTGTTTEYSLCAVEEANPLVPYCVYNP